MAVAEAVNERFDITELIRVASYNWLGTIEPTILVPGQPAMWVPLLFEKKLRPDSGSRFVDQNAGRSPLCPMEPLMKAVQHEQPQFDLTNVDLVSDRWALSRILRLCVLTPNGDQDESFDFLAQVVGRTVVFILSEAESIDIVGTKTNFRGFRDNYDEAHLRYRADCAESASHHAIIQYKLGGLRILLRHKVNGFYPEKAPEAMMSLLSLVEDVDGADRASEQPEANEDLEDRGLSVKSAGFPVDHSALFELSTAQKVRTIEGYFEKEVPEQWLSQTPNFIRVVLDYKRLKNVHLMRATVAETDHRRASDDVANWVDDNQGALRQFSEKLSGLVEELRQRAGGIRKVFKVRRKLGVEDLEISEVEAMDVPVLPQKWCDRIATKPGQDVDAVPEAKRLRGE